MKPSGALWPAVFGCTFSLLLAGCPIPSAHTPGETRIFDGIEFQWCPPGLFLMGSPTNEAGRESNEKLHLVRLTQGFWIGKYEVTQEQWEALMGDDPFLTHPEYPMVAVTWNDARDFLTALRNASDSSGTYRLPTEAEWEYACRAGTTTRFYWGDDLGESEIDGFEWYSANSSIVSQPVGINPVGLKEPNPWGIHDMGGNARELCRDWYAPYSSGGSIDPKGPVTGTYRVVRGGSWFDDAAGCRSAQRRTFSPSGMSGHVGFRLVRTEPARAAL